MGVAFARLGKFKEAVQEFETFIKEVPESSAAYYNLGRNYYSLGEVDLAIAAFKKAVAIDPSDDRSKKNLTTLEELRTKFF
jgi:tetratricopeptide (TPR) repeat protein